MPAGPLEIEGSDTAKVMLLCVYDLCEKFNLQKAEIKALFNALVDEHIEETDLLDEDVDYYERQMASHGGRKGRGS